MAYIDLVTSRKYLDETMGLSTPFMTALVAAINSGRRLYDSVDRCELEPCPYTRWYGLLGLTHRWHAVLMDVVAEVLNESRGYRPSHGRNLMFQSLEYGYATHDTIAVLLVPATPASLSWG